MGVQNNANLFLAENDSRIGNLVIPIHCGGNDFGNLLGCGVIEMAGVGYVAGVGGQSDFLAQIVAQLRRNLRQRLVVEAELAGVPSE